MSSGSESEHVESEDYKSEEEEISDEFNAEMEESFESDTQQQSEHKGSKLFSIRRHCIADRKLVRRPTSWSQTTPYKCHLVWATFASALKGAFQPNVLEIKERFGKRTKSVTI